MTLWLLYLEYDMSAGVVHFHEFDQKEMLTLLIDRHRTTMDASADHRLSSRQRHRAETVSI